MSSYDSESWTRYAEEISIVSNRVQSNDVSKVVQVIQEAVANGKTIWVFGNGGSASTASHFCVDLSKGAAARLNRQIHALPLMDMVPIQTAWSNDFSYDDAMALSLTSQARDQDLVLVITGSGNSKNIVNVVKKAKDLGLVTLGLTGFDGGLVRNLLDMEIHVPSNDIQIVEDIHHAICHFISKVV